MKEEIKEPEEIKVKPDEIGVNSAKNEKTILTKTEPAVTVEKITVPNENENDGFNNNKLGLKERGQISEKVKLLANDGLASLVRLIQEECPNSIEDVDDEYLQIKLSDLEKKTYDQINQ